MTKISKVECHVCHVEDELQNLTKVSNVNDAYAHSRCIERHNKDVKKNLRALDASLAAGFVRDDDVDVDNSYAVETVLRQRNPKASRQFITEVIEAAREQRDRDNVNALFERIETNVKAWPAEVGEDFIEEVAGGLIGIIPRLDIGEDDPRFSNETMTAARYAALLLIKQVAWRKCEAELKAGYEEWLAAEESTSDVA